MAYVSVVIVLIAVAFVVSRRSRDKFKYAFWESVEYCVYSATCLHVLVVVFNAALPDLNTVVQSLYRFMQLFMLDIKAVVQPQCQRSMPLLHIEALQFVGGICLVLTLVLLPQLHRCARGADSDGKGTRRPASREPDLARQRRSVKDAIAASVSAAATKAGYLSAPRVVSIDAHANADEQVDTVVLDNGTAYERPSSTIAMADVARAGDANRDAWVHHRVTRHASAMMQFRYSRFQRALLFAMTLVYPVICISWFRMVDCAMPLGSPHAVLRFDTTIRCYAGMHFYVGVLAWACFCVYIIGWPLFSFAYLWLTRKQHGTLLADAHWHGTWAFYFQLEARSYWTRHFDILMLFFLSILVSRSLDAPGAVLGGTVAILSCYATILLWARPYQPTHRWWLLFKLAVLVVAALAAILNFLLYRTTEAPQSGFALAASAVSFIVYVATLLLLAALLYKMWRLVLRLAGLRSGKPIDSVSLSAAHTRACCFTLRKCFLAASHVQTVDDTATNLDDITLRVTEEPDVQVRNVVGERKPVQDLGQDVPASHDDTIAQTAIDGMWEHSLPPPAGTKLPAHRLLHDPRRVRSLPTLAAETAGVHDERHRSVVPRSGDSPAPSFLKTERGKTRSGFRATQARSVHDTGKQFHVEAVSVRAQGNEVAAGSDSASLTSPLPARAEPFGRSAALALLKRTRAAPPSQPKPPKA